MKNKSFYFLSLQTQWFLRLYWLTNIAYDFYIFLKICEMICAYLINVITLVRTHWLFGRAVPRSRRTRTSATTENTGSPSGINTDQTFPSILKVWFLHQFNLIFSPYPSLSFLPFLHGFLKNRHFIRVGTRGVKICIPIHLVTFITKFCILNEKYIVLHIYLLVNILRFEFRRLFSSIIA